MPQFILYVVDRQPPRHGICSTKNMTAVLAIVFSSSALPSLPLPLVVWRGGPGRRRLPQKQVPSHRLARTADGGTRAADGQTRACNFLFKSPPRRPSVLLQLLLPFLTSLSRPPTPTDVGLFEEGQRTTSRLCRATQDRDRML